MIQLFKNERRKCTNDIFKKDIKFILEKGKKFFGEFLTIIYINDNSLTNHLELLISVPKKN